MVTIRLSRGGAKKRPFYHVVVTDSRNPRDGRCTERLGYYNPFNVNELNIDATRLAYWLSQGAQPSQRVARLMKQIAKVAAAA